LNFGYKITIGEINTPSYQTRLGIVAAIPKQLPVSNAKNASA